MADGDMPRARFHSMCEGTKEDWDCISQAMKPFIVELPDRVLAHLKMLQGDCGGFAIDRLEHCLQTATRAHRDGRDEEYVVCALLHDMGDILGPRNHADIAAAILKPFVSEQNHWMVEKHAIFQGYYFFHHLGLDRNMRERVPRPPVVRRHRGVLPPVRRPRVRSALRQHAARGVRADGAAGVRQREEFDLRAEDGARAGRGSASDD